MIDSERVKWIVLAETENSQIDCEEKVEIEWFKEERRKNWRDFAFEIHSNLTRAFTRNRIQVAAKPHFWQEFSFELNKKVENYKRSTTNRWITAILSSSLSLESTLHSLHSIISFTSKSWILNCSSISKILQPSVRGMQEWEDSSRMTNLWVSVISARYFIVILIRI